MSTFWFLEYFLSIRIMKIYQTEFLGEDCNICGIGDASPLKIARAMTDKVLDNEKLHYHIKGHEYYIFIRGVARICVGTSKINLSAGQMLYIEPGEVHKIEEILEPSDYVVINTNPDPKDKVVLEQ